jgi:hypothetical protein
MLKAFFVWKKCPTSSLILMETLPPIIKDLIQDIHLVEKPFILTFETEWPISPYRKPSQSLTSK